MKHYIKFDQNNIQKSYIAENQCDREDTKRFKDGAFLAPEKFNPKIDMCKLNNGTVSMMSDSEINLYTQDKNDKLERENKLFELKLECNKRIRTFNNTEHSNIDWILKSQNYQDIKHQYLNNVGIKKAGGSISEDMIISDVNYINAKKILDRKDRFIKKYHTIKEIIKNMDVSELKAFDSKDDKHWEGL